jgi:hypothetical protein
METDRGREKTWRGGKSAGHTQYEAMDFPAPGDEGKPMLRGELRRGAGATDISDGGVHGWRRDHQRHVRGEGGVRLPSYPQLPQ